MKLSIEKFNRHQLILIDKTVRDETEIRILNAMDDLGKWLNNERKKRLTSIDLESEEGNLDIGHILCDYMRENDMLDAEEIDQWIIRNTEWPNDSV